jgi:hypothetical protein
MASTKDSNGSTITHKAIGTYSLSEVAQSKDTQDMKKNRTGHTPRDTFYASPKCPFRMGQRWQKPAADRRSGSQIVKHRSSKLYPLVVDQLVFALQAKL